MQTINEYRKQQAKREKLETIIVGALFGLIWILGSLCIVAAQVK